MANAMTLVFEEETEKKGFQEKWELVFNARTECRKCVQVLVKAWKQLFKVDLSIVTKNS